MTSPAPIPTGIDWDVAFANTPHIPGGAEYPARWAAQSSAFRAQVAGALDQPYGPGGRQRFDLFTPAARARGTVVFVHGGYWRAFDQGDWSHLAAGSLAAGWACALVGYTLAPEATIAQMTAEVARAIPAIAARTTGPIHLAGHSAGGHLVTRMACAPALLPGDVRARVGNIVSISGLHDLRPLVLTQMNDTLHLTDAMALAESPALLTALPGARVTAWVGADERPEFLRQARLLADAWPGTRLVIDPDRHHFDVVEGLCDPAHPLMQAVLHQP